MSEKPPFFNPPFSDIFRVLLCAMLPNVVETDAFRHPKTLILLNLWNLGYVHLIACQYPAEHVSLAKLSSMWLDTSETAIILSFEFNCGIFSNMSEKYV